MSQEEQDAILGRTVRAIGNLTIEIAALELKLTMFRKQSERIANEVESFLKAYQSASQVEVLAKALESHLAPNEALDAVRELHQKRQEKVELDSKRKAMQPGT